MDNSRDLDLEKQIDAYIKGHLSVGEAEELWKSLLKRPRYIELLETELTLKLIIEEQLDSEKKSRKKAPSKSRKSVRSTLANSWKWLAAAASVIILVVAINYLQLEKGQTLQELALGEINMVENLASPEVMRSEEMMLTTVDSLLNVGFKAALSGDVTKAKTIYNEVISDHNDDANVSMAYLNLGIIEYNAQNYEQAAAAFNDAIARVQEDPVLEEKAYWYLGNSYVKLDRQDKAGEMLHKAYEMDGIYKKPALRMLKKLDYTSGTFDANAVESK